MNKMMLIIDEPKDCYHCPIHKTQCLSLTGTNPDYNLIGKRPDWCPLRSVPPKHYHSAYGYGQMEMGEDKIWNACVDEILKGGSNGI